MKNQILRISLTLLVCSLLHACAVAVGTGVAVGASTAIDKRTTGTVIEDQTIEMKSSQAFRADPEIRDQAHWNVTSYNTKVLLSGEAINDNLRRRMEEIVRNIPKVTEVFNELTVAAPSSMMSRSSDTVITTKVKSLLLADKETKGLSVKVVTEKGVVYLMGLVSRQQADRATEITRQTGGVQKVVKLFEYLD
jgi:osmotically-inducible protein OsmY